MRPAAVNAPCRTRNATSVCRSCAVLHRSEAAVKPAMHVAKYARLPKSFVRNGLSGIATTFEMMYPVTIQMPSSIEAPMLPSIVGSATLTIVESRVSRSEANMTAITMRSRRVPNSTTGIAPGSGGASDSADSIGPIS